jgi:conjugal transfer pilus assembly protein TraD
MFHRSEGRWLHGLGPRKNRDVEIDTGILQGHTLVVGTTGTGKTRFLDLLIAQAIWRGETVIVIDPKGDPDLREKMKLACERMGASDRYMFFHPAMPKESVRIDPLKNWQETTEVASRVSALIHSETENDPFKNFCWQALNWIVDGMV